MLEHAIQHAVVGGFWGGILGAIGWVVHRFRTADALQKPSRRLSDDEAASKPEPTIDDPAASPIKRRSAWSRLGKLVRKVSGRDMKIWRPRAIGPKLKRLLIWVALCAAWLAFCAVQYAMTLSRMTDCEQGYMNALQISLCVRHAIEAKYFILAWGPGAPLLVALAVIFGVELKKLFRSN